MRIYQAVHYTPAARGWITICEHIRACTFWRGELLDHARTGSARGAFCEQGLADGYFVLPSPRSAITWPLEATEASTSHPAIRQSGGRRTASHEQTVSIKRQATVNSSIANWAKTVWESAAWRGTRIV